MLSGGGALGLAHIGVIRELERIGIVPDMIAGTSMGSIVGGLYACGYSPDQIEEIVLKQDWDELFEDKLTRKNLNIDERQRDGIYFFDVPISKKGIIIPSGLIKGQRITSLFTELTLPVYEIDDFSKLPIPFVALAADIESGTSVPLDSGHLPLVMKASMAIPTVFQPVELNGRVLVDGGLVDNYPAMELKKRGADIIIGVDVQAPLLKKEELNSMIRIMYQAIKFLRMENYKKAIEITDIFIQPNTEEYGPNDFQDARQLIAIGEIATKRNIFKLEDLKKKLDSFGYEKKEHSIEQIDSIYIARLDLSKIEEKYRAAVNYSIKYKFPSKIATKDLDDIIEQIYSTRLFKQVDYRLEKFKGSSKIVISATPKDHDDLYVGINYNSDIYASLNFGGVFSNLLIDDTRLYADFRLGNSPAFNIYYQYYLANLWNIGIKTDLENFEVFVWDDRESISSLRFTDFTVDVIFRKEFGKSSASGLGIEFEYTSFGSQINPFLNFSRDRGLINYYIYFRHDSFDKPFFPNRGAQIFTESKIISNDFDGDGTLDFAQYAIFKYEQAIELNNALTWIYRVDGGALWSGSEDVPQQYFFYLGGLGRNYINGIFRFAGMEFMQRAGRSSWIAASEFQYEVFKNFYATLILNAAETELDLNFGFDEFFYYGGGLAFGYDTLIGPIEFFTTFSSEQTRPIFYFNIGLGL